MTDDEIRTAARELIRQLLAPKRDVIAEGHRWVSLAAQWQLRQPLPLWVAVNTARADA